MPILGFPQGFVWGTATAAYQIEGAVKEDGRGESIWDRFSHTPGNVLNGDTGDIACDHYHRYPEDIRLMQDLGLPAYRLSISWPRVFPEGKGNVNEHGLDFYQRLVEGLLGAGITPFVTLYHWDLPQALQDEGGWANRDTASYFAEYADLVGRRLGDRVGYWITHNEPAIAAFVGHYFGEHAPGRRDLGMAVQVSHNLLVSHGEAVEALRALERGLQIGITLNLSPAQPASDAHVEAAQRQDGFANRWFLDPLFRGSYPEDMLALYGDLAPAVQAGDLETISAPIDFLGVNYYFRTVVEDDPEGAFPQTRTIRPEGAEYTGMRWEVYPQGLYEVLMRLHQEYRVPRMFITENGAAFPDAIDADGQIRDDRRLAYLEAHLTQAQRAIQDGAPLSGYFVWSLMDNFEWARGYSQRFGIVYVDYEDQQRIVKSSGHWYGDVVRQNGSMILT
ncbi:MAG: GH1 family beta-glucosidase [Chloroflexi bacterium]|nr:GH1 family beta-glucosidase [Chloroflexota bacterium]